MSRATSGLRALRALRPALLVVGAIALVGVAEPLADRLLGLGGGLGTGAHALAVLAVRAAAGYLLGIALGAGRARLARSRQLGLLVPAAVVALWPLAVPPLAETGLVPDGWAGLVPAQLPPFAAVVVGLALASRRR